MKRLVPRDERRPVSMRGFALSPNRDSDVIVEDLSYGGCRIRSADKFKPGETFELRVIKRGAMPVQVRWANDGRVGAQFIN